MAEQSPEVLRIMLKALLAEREGVRAILFANLQGWRAVQFTEAQFIEIKHRLVGMLDDALSSRSVADVVAGQAKEAVAETPPPPPQKPLSPKNQRRQVNRALRDLKRFKDKLTREHEGGEAADDAEVGRIYAFPGGSED